MLFCKLLKINEINFNIINIIKNIIYWFAHYMQ